MSLPDRTAVVVSRVSMLRICTFGDCTTIVFGSGTCVEHDLRELAAAHCQTDAYAAERGDDLAAHAAAAHAGSPA